MLAQLFITILLVAAGFWLAWRFIGRRAVANIEARLADKRAEATALDEKIAALRAQFDELEKTDVEIEVTRKLHRVGHKLSNRKSRLAKLDDSLSNTPREHGGRHET